MSSELLFVPVKIFLILFSGFTVAYHVSLLFSLPTRFLWMPLIVFVLLFSKISRAKTTGLKKISTRWSYSFFGIIAVAFSMGTMTLLNSRPDADDIFFVHRALITAYETLGPPVVNTEYFDEKGLPPISILHGLTSIEVSACLIGKVLGAPLWFYFNGVAFLAAFLFVLVVALLLNSLGLSSWEVFGGTILCIAFLMLDGNLHRSFGNFTLVRFWQGKCVLVGVIIPLFLLLARRFCLEPSKQNFFLLFMAGVSSVGMSGSAVFMVPIFLFSVSLSSIFASSAHEKSVKAFLKFLGLNLGGGFPLLVGIFLYFGMLPSPDMAIFTQWEPTWWRNLWVYVVGDWTTLARNILIILMIPIVSLSGEPRRFLLGLSAINLIVFANPLTGPLFVEAEMVWKNWTVA